MALSFRESVELAHELGATYELGYWKFPTDEARQLYLRRSQGLEWTEEQRQNAAEALKKLREAAAQNANMIPLEPEGK